MSESDPRDDPAIGATADFGPASFGEDDRRAQTTTPAVYRSLRPQSNDVRDILQRRLRFLALLFSAAAAVMVFFPLLNVAVENKSPPPDFWFYVGVYVSVFAIGTAITAVLYRRRSLSMRILRTLELALFGALALLWSFVQIALYPRFRLEQPPIWFGFVLANSVSAPWALTIIAYGVFIPNTWRRCAAVVVVMAAMPVVVNASTGVAAAATVGHPQANFFITVGTWMAAAGAIAVYGSHRIEVLRQEVLAARQLGQYRLLRRLGTGGMGEVYLAEHRFLKRPCAVKLIRPEKAGDPALLHRFEREVQAMTRLTHWNVVEVFDYGRADDGTFYYVMEYLPGQTLDELVKINGPLPPARAIHFLTQICAALREAHSKGLIHRDLKPGNVIVGERGGVFDVAKLLDFGLVQGAELEDSADKLTQYGAIVGTPAYMSPEQAQGRGELQAASDIYSLGAVGYFLLTGQPPFERPSVVQTVAAHITDPPVPPSRLRTEISSDLEQVILTCLEKDGGRRFADADAVENALKACCVSGTWSQAEAAAWSHSNVVLDG